MIFTMISYLYIWYHNKYHTYDIIYDIDYDKDYDIREKNYDIIVHVIPVHGLKKTIHAYDIIVKLWYHMYDIYYDIIFIYMIS